VTQLRFHPGSISNYFDMLLNGIGHRGSSFSDIDAVSHDKSTHRFLLQEFKREGEEIPIGQHWMLQDLARLKPAFTVWHVIRRADGAIGFAEYGTALSVITVNEYQERFRSWWANTAYNAKVSMLKTANPDHFKSRTERVKDWSDSDLARYLDFVKSSIESEDDRVWLEVLETETRRRSVAVITHHERRTITAV
jgi:hypothetical protein